MSVCQNTTNLGFIQKNDKNYSNVKTLISRADSLRCSYDFRKSVDVYEEVIFLLQDSLHVADSVAFTDSLSWIYSLKMLSENGLNMKEFCSTPEVVARQKFSIDDFFLFYPLENHSWRPLPNCLDSLSNGSGLVKATYFPENSNEIYYPSKDMEGSYNLYHSHLQDTIWSVPELINEDMTTVSNEIYPILSPDGKSLYFASNGLYGMGGYDLYVSNWDEDKQDWGMPTNMGFPFSSPKDDFLYMNTADGKYTIFASNRDCSADSVYLYVLEYDPMPVRKRIDDPKELLEIAKLCPKNNPSRLDNESVVSKNMSNNANIKRYTDQMSKVRHYKELMSSTTAKLDVMRNSLSSETADKVEKIKDVIIAMESKLPIFQDSLDIAVKKLQTIEMEFLLSGVSIDPSQLREEADREVVGASSAYTFMKNDMGDNFEINILKPEPKFDYGFKILPKGQFAENQELPRGLVYQIQMFTVSRKVSENKLRGLSPVFERRNPTGSYTYSVGLFKDYKSVLSKLNKVRSRGFRTAYITAYKDGKYISVSKARKLEKERSFVYMLNIYPGGDSLPDVTMLAISQQSNADIVKTIEDGKTVFMVGPFKDKNKVEALMASIKATGVNNVSVKPVKK